MKYLCITLKMHYNTLEYWDVCENILCTKLKDSWLTVIAKKKKKRKIFFADNPDAGAGSRFPIIKLQLEFFSVSFWCLNYIMTLILCMSDWVKCGSFFPRVDRLSSSSGGGVEWECAALHRLHSENNNNSQRMSEWMNEWINNIECETMAAWASAAVVAWTRGISQPTCIFHAVPRRRGSLCKTSKSGNLSCPWVQVWVRWLFCFVFFLDMSTLAAAHERA